MRLVIAATILLFVFGSAGAYPTVYFEPDQLVMEPSEACTLGIRIDNGTDTLTCFRVRFSFNEAVVELNSAQEGSLFSESGHQTMFDWDALSLGHHECNDVTLGFDAFVLCPGELVHLELEAATAGTTTLALYDVDLRDIRRDPILPMGIGNCSVTVLPETGVQEEQGVFTGRLRCFPNPFWSHTRIEFDACGDSPVEFRVYDVSGRAVATPEAERVSETRSAAHWDGTGCSGMRLPAGVYFVEAVDGRARSRARATLLR
ncbi:MAG: hypothetical protein JXB46_09760 [Candidatus Eisenbacteria bacterium]|nr:hypothetical protein [Candidatus Eisenbacteria bacterium]